MFKYKNLFILYITKQIVKIERDSRVCRNDASHLQRSDKTDIISKQVMVRDRSDKVVDKISSHSFYFLH